jgi:methylglutaconyl-CoA hydratase
LHAVSFGTLEYEPHGPRIAAEAPATAGVELYSVQLPMTAASFETLKLKFDPIGIATLTLNRPETSNAFDDVMIDELMWAFAVLVGDPRVRVIVLDSVGRSFCAGSDLNWMKRAGEQSSEDNLADARRFAAVMQTIHESPKPIIARVQGAASGAGVGLCSVCDIVLAAPQARFCLSQARQGVVPAIIGPYLVNVIGKREAQRLALTGEAISATRALELQLVSEVVADEDMDDAVRRVASQMLGNGPLAMAETKSLFRQLQGGEVDAETRELTAQIIANVRATDEAREGMTAYLEKRAPSFAPSRTATRVSNAAAAAAAAFAASVMEDTVPGDLSPIATPTPAVRLRLSGMKGTGGVTASDAIGATSSVTAFPTQRGPMLQRVNGRPT